jgi:hypothetical protein
MNRRHDHGRPAIARRSPDDAASFASVVDGLTDSEVQDISKLLVRQGCGADLGNSRKLRAAVREVVARNVQR